VGGASGAHVAAVPGDRRSRSRPDASRDVFSGAWLRHARCGEPPSAAAPLGTVLRDTGLPSRSALVAPPLRLAALRWRVASVILGRRRPPPGVSTACLVAVARFSVTRLPRIATLENVPTRDRGARGTFSRSGTSHRCALSRTQQAHVILVLWGAREGAQLGGGASGARGCGARRPPVAFRPDASRDVFQRRLAPPRALRRTSSDSSAPAPGTATRAAENQRQRQRRRQRQDSAKRGSHHASSGGSLHSQARSR
jgi:hypothetical protein